MANKKALVLYVVKQKYMNEKIGYLIKSNHSSNNQTFDFPEYPIDFSVPPEGSDSYKYCESIFINAIRETLASLPYGQGDILEKGRLVEYEVKYNTEYASFGSVTRTECTNYLFESRPSKVALKEHEIEFFMKVLFDLRHSNMPQK